MIGAAREIARDIKLSHSVFALPFAALGAVYAATRGAGDGTASGALGGAAPDWSAFILTAVLVLACMVSARTAAMLANRILDREIDARNPRTAGRALPSGRLSLGAAITGYLIACAIFVLCTAAFGVLNSNWWPLWLSVPVLAWISAYALFKRFTLFCHVWLGACLAISPAAAALAVNPDALRAPAPWLMSGMVLCWVAGFDVIYALQDVAVDQREGLHSAPSKLGVSGALWFARALHVAAIGFLVALWAAEPAQSGTTLSGPTFHSPLFGAAVALAALLLLVEHLTVHKWGTTKIAATFTLVNGGLSVLVGTAGVLDLVLVAPPS